MKEIILPAEVWKIKKPFNIIDYDIRNDGINALEINRENLNSAFEAYRNAVEAIAKLPDIALEEISKDIQAGWILFDSQFCALINNLENNVAYDKIKEMLEDVLKDDVEDKEIRNSTFFWLRGKLYSVLKSAHEFIKRSLQSFYHQKHPDLSWLQQEYVKLADEYAETDGENLSFYLEEYVGEKAVPVLEKIVPYIEDEGRRAQVIYSIRKFIGEDLEEENADD